MVTVAQRVARPGRSTNPKVLGIELIMVVDIKSTRQRSRVLVAIEMMEEWKMKDLVLILAETSNPCVDMKTRTWYLLSAIGI